jgi:type IV pilus assembly protein PilE
MNKFKHRSRSSTVCQNYCFQGYCFQGYCFQGYSLIELLITLTILAIIISFALPGWQQLLTTVRRNDATTALTRLATKQEQFYLQQHRYARTDELALAQPAGLGLSIAHTGYYDLVSTMLANGFSATATVTSDGLQKNDAHCWLFGIDATGRRWAETYSGSDSTRQCWKS